jgi:type IV secretory pathway TrbL component
MARDGEHFFMWFLAIWTSSFEKVLFGSVVHFIGSLIWGEFTFEVPIYSGYQSLV